MARIESSNKSSVIKKKKHSRIITSNHLKMEENPTKNFKKVCSNLQKLEAWLMIINMKIVQFSQLFLLLKLFGFYFSSQIY